MARLEGKIAIVTGASRGIGRATAKLFAQEGAKVAVLARTADSVAAVVADIERAGGETVGITCDVADAAQIEAAVAQVVNLYGGVDILVNNAFDPSVVSSPIIDLSVEQLQRNFDTGPIAHLRMMQACFPYLKASTQGRVINFASIAGVTGMVPYGPYAMAKEASRALTRVAAREWGPHGITVNNVLPVAATYEEMTEAGVPAPNSPLARLGSPEDDIAPVVLFLASKDGQFLTGYSLSADGGMMIDSAR